MLYIFNYKPYINSNPLWNNYVTTINTRLLRKTKINNLFIGLLNGLLFMNQYVCIYKAYSFRSGIQLNLYQFDGKIDLPCFIIVCKD